MKYDSNGRLRVFADGVVVNVTSSVGGINPNVSNDGIEVVNQASDLDFSTSFVVTGSEITRAQISASFASPSSIGTSNSSGTSTNLVRSDHVHAHGDLPGGSLHETATSIASGFIHFIDYNSLVSTVSSSISASSIPVQDNSIVRWDGALGCTVQDSKSIITDSGDLFTTGSVVAYGGLSGSLQTLTDGSPYLLSTGSITLVTNSLGQIVIGANPDDFGSVTEVELVSGLTRTRYSTIGAAITAAVSGDQIVVGPGNYSESFTVPSGISIRGDTGSVVILGSSPVGTKITLENNAYVEGFTIVLSADSSPTVSYSGDGIAYLRDTFVVGATTNSIGFETLGSGKLLINDLAYIDGPVNTLFKCTSGSMTVQSGFIASGSTINSIFHLNGGRGELDTFSTRDAHENTVIDTVFLAGSGSMLISNCSFENVLTGTHVIEDGHNLSIRATKFTSTTYDFYVDSSVVSGTINGSAVEMDLEKVFIPGGFAKNATIIGTIFDPTLPEPNLTVLSEMRVGSPFAGRESAFGEGDSYTLGMVVLTTDNTATSTTDGGNFINVSSEARSINGSSFGFQGTSSNHTILVGSGIDNGDDFVKHWGLKINQLTAAVEITKRSFAFEYWNGSSWISFDVLATESSEYYRYANEVFIRANSNEHIRYGITNQTTWSKKTIAGLPLFWIRIRITNNLTTSPTFERFKLSTNRMEINSDGTNTYHGRSRFRQTLQSAGNIFGESGGVTNFNLPVGSGGVPTGWNHNIKNSDLNGNGDAIYFQMSIPRGIDTSQPVNLSFKFDSTVTTSVADIDLICSLIAIESEGVLEADPSGGIIPIERTLSNTEELTSKAGQTKNLTLNNLHNNKIMRMDFEGFTIANYYEGDILFIRLEYDNDGPLNPDIGILTAELSAVRWTHGGRL